MAVDKLVDSSQLDSDLTTVANAIRAKTGGASQLAFPSGFVSGIGSIPTGTPRTSADLTASGDTVTAPAGNYASSASKSVAAGSVSVDEVIIESDPTISVDSSGLITASYSDTGEATASVTPGYVSSANSGTYSVSGSSTRQLATQAAQTIHPSLSDQSISSGKYLTGVQTIKAVVLANLLAENIKSGVTVKVGDSTDDDCVASVLGTYTGILKTADGTFTGNGTRQMTVSCAFEPDLIYWATDDPGGNTFNGVVSGIIVRDMMAAVRYRNNSTANSNGADYPVTDMNSSPNGYNFKATYSEGVVTIRCASNNSRAFFANNETYSYKFIKWTA